VKLIGDGGPLVPIPKGDGSIIPSRAEIVKDLIKWFATEYGLEIAEAMFAKIDIAKLKQAWLDSRAKQGLPLPSTRSSGGGLVLVLGALLLFGGKKRKR
jgi:hypothetical protein